MPRSNDDYVAELTRLAKIFEELETPVAIPSANSDLGVIVAIDTTAEMVDRHARQRDVAKLRSALAEGGALVIAAFNEGVLQHEELRELIAMYELNESGNWATTPANLFALFLGGPNIELDVNGQIVRCERPRPGVSFEHKGASSDVVPEGRACTSATEGVLPRQMKVNPEQCRWYAQGCRALVNQLKEKVVSPRAQAAMRQYEFALGILEGEATDEQAHALLQSAYEDKPDLVDHLGTLPSLDTWTRYLRGFRNVHSEQKHKPRRGREKGSRSVVKREDL